MSITHSIRKLMRATGFDVVRHIPSDQVRIEPDFDPGIVETVRHVHPFTMTSSTRVAALCQAVRYIARSKIQGDIVECGVWRGGSMMAIVRTLLEEHDSSRNLFLYDTFEGMPPPGQKDIDYDGGKASDLMQKSSKEDPRSIWCVAPLEAVRQTLLGEGYPENHIRFIQGKVEETIPGTAPASIALLRLDTDWYESTRHELIHLFPRLVKGGVLIIDDYGHWKGARQAVDEYFAESGYRILLNRIDYSGRIAVKVD